MSINYTLLNCTNIDGHEMAVAARVHVLQHMTLIKHSIPQIQLAEKTTVTFIAYCQVISEGEEKKQNKKNNHNRLLHSTKVRQIP